jgi:hypothetical protein
MRIKVVVPFMPIVDLLDGVLEIMEKMLVQALISESAVKLFT